MQINLDQAHTRLHSYLDNYISGDRKQALLDMYEDLGERVYLSPASSFENFHNAFPGGYIDHILRVTDFAMQVYTLYTELGLDVSDFTEENLVFAALHHDLGKLGFPGEGSECYVVNDSEWHRNKLGQIYKHNSQNPFMLIQDQSLFLLQHYKVPMDWVEYITIKIHDGIYDDTNKPYYVSKSDDAKLRSNLPFIVHTADLMAAKFEYERWKKNTGTKPSLNVKRKQNGKSKNEEKTVTESSDLNKAFDALFGGNPKS